MACGAGASCLVLLTWCQMLVWVGLVVRARNQSGATTGVVGRGHTVLKEAPPWKQGACCLEED